MNFDAIDVYAMLQPMIDKGGWYWRADTGKLDRIASTQEARTPWVHHHHLALGLDDCHFWNDIIFTRFDIMPSYCMDCYKVVIVPNTVDQLFRLCDVQAQLIGMPSKCGLEIRDSTPRLYGGYHYCRGVEKGREVYELMRTLVTKHIGGDVRIGLKRGCTEYETEKAFGKSDTWPEIVPEQIEFEKKIRELITDPPEVLGQSEHLVKHVKNKWVVWAHAHADMTYLPYCNNKPLHEPYVLYAGAL